MTSVLYRILAKEHRDQILEAFFFAFEELNFVLTSKTVDLNRKHPNFLNAQRKIEKQIVQFKKLRKTSQLILFLFKNFYEVINNEFDLLYEANFNPNQFDV